MTIHFIIYKHLYVGELRRYNDRSSEFKESLGNLNKVMVNKMTDPDIDLSHLHVVLYCRADPGKGGVR